MKYWSWYRSGALGTMKRALIWLRAVSKNYLTEEEASKLREVISTLEDIQENKFESTRKFKEELNEARNPKRGN